MYQTLSEFALFCKRYDKNISVHSSVTAVHLQNANDKFHKVELRHYSGEAETFTFLYDKFTQDNMYQILSQSVRFCRLYIKKNVGVLFRFTG